MSYRQTNGPCFEQHAGLEPALFHIGSVVPYLLGECCNLISFLYSLYIMTDYYLCSNFLYTTFNVHSVSIYYIESTCPSLQYVIHLAIQDSYTVGLHHSRHLLLSLYKESNPVILCTKQVHHLLCFRGSFNYSRFSYPLSFSGALL